MFSFCSRFDARYNPLDEAKHWADDSLGGRASFHYTEDPAKLKIENVKDSDTGVFKCRVDFQKSPTRNYLVNLTVISKYLIQLKIECLTSLSAGHFPLNCL